MAKTFLSADNYLRDMWRLAAKIMAGGWKPDVLIALWRGGAPVGVAIHEYFKVAGWRDIRHTAIKCSSYTGVNANDDDVRFEYSAEVIAALKAGEKVLIVDDVFDTGKTALAVKRMMDVKGVDMRLATVYWKPSKNLTNMKPDYNVNEVSDDWIVFPHEIAELDKDEIKVKDPLLAELLG